MKLLFNKDNKGNAELKSLLGHLDADYKFINLQTDIEHATADFVKLIGQTTYDKIVFFYNQAELDQGADQVAKDQRELEDDLVKKAQLPIAAFAELAFASNNDINTSNNGRKIDLATDQEKPFEWQIARAESNSRRRGYKSMDVLIDTLDNYGLTEWDNSDEYKASKELFIHTTDQMQKIFQIDNSRQLYLRLLQYMEDPEQDDILPIIGETRFAALKVKIVDNTLLDADKILLKKIQKPVGFKALESAFTVLPVEMFPSGIVEYREKGRMASQARAEVLLYFKDHAEKYLIKLQQYIAKLDLTATAQDPEEFIEGEKFVNL